VLHGQGDESIERAGDIAAVTPRSTGLRSFQAFLLEHHVEMEDFELGVRMNVDRWTRDLTVVNAMDAHIDVSLERLPLDP
jgi:hypothetical protein